jgi:hypothetical protein
MSSNIPKKFDTADPQNIKISPIDFDKKQAINIPYKGREINSKALSEFTLLLYLETKTSEILNGADNTQELIDFLTSLKHFKYLLEALMTKDSSKDYLFADDLSTTWHSIIDSMVEKSLHKPLSGQSLKQFIHSIHHYPEKTDHTLGFYLTESTGERWLPLPFMQILYHLHKEALLSPKTSTLGSWVKTLDSLIYSPTP